MIRAHIFGVKELEKWAMGTFAVLLEKHAFGAPEDLLRLAKNCKEFMWYESNAGASVLSIEERKQFLSVLMTGMSLIWYVFVEYPPHIFTGRVEELPHRRCQRYKCA